ncbi:sodium-independent anion transporter, partial [Bradyrhizobium sp. NBAIM20]|nr:sodium-independent anion transporter [Bradyrhizobium sp. NBAIM20]
MNKTLVAALTVATVAGSLVTAAPSAKAHDGVGAGIAAAIGLIEISDLKRIYRIQRWEFWLTVLCFVGVAVLGAI